MEDLFQALLKNILMVRQGAWPPRTLGLNETSILAEEAAMLAKWLAGVTLAIAESHPEDSHASTRAVVAVASAVAGLCTIKPKHACTQVASSSLH